MNDRFNNLYNLLIAYQSVINYARNNFNGELQINNLDKGVASKINLFKNNNDAEGLEKWATTAYERVYQTLSGIAYKRGRINTVDDESKKIGRYNKIRVNGTNVFCIALFTMNGFELSDAIKHGALRQNGKTDELLGIDPSNRKTVQSLSRGKKSFDKIENKRIYYRFYNCFFIHLSIFVI